MCAFCTFLIGHVVVDGWLKKNSSVERNNRIIELFVCSGDIRMF